MPATRREFIDSLALSTLSGGLLLSGLPVALKGMSPTDPSVSAGAAGAEGLAASVAPQDGWDTGWGARLTGRLKTVFDVPEIEGGVPVWRASIWAAQYEAVLRIPPSETSTALVLRHHAVVLAMQQSAWDRYDLGEAFKVTHPLTGEPTKRNVALLGAADGVGEPFSNFALDRFLARGGVALACDLALRVLVVPIVRRVEGVSEDEAYVLARRGLIPGVILQPSGMFAVVRAQEAGAFYFAAS